MSGVAAGKVRGDGDGCVDVGQVGVDSDEGLRSNVIHRQMDTGSARRDREVQLGLDEQRERLADAASGAQESYFERGQGLGGHGHDMWGVESVA